MNTYTKEYFIEKFNSIPDENWVDNGLLKHPTKENCGCALFHCGIRLDENEEYYIPTEEALALIELFGNSVDEDSIDYGSVTNTEYINYSCVYRINDKAKFFGLSPKQAIIKKLESL